jgi:ketosteroid isomerase-like protein
MASTVGGIKKGMAAMTESNSREFPLDVVKEFVDRINAGDAAGLSTLATEDHRFIDSLGNVVTGREKIQAGWTGYFGMVPDYRLAAEQWITDGDVVVMFGTASGTYCPDGSVRPERHWSTPVCCRAVVNGDKLVEWRVYADNEPIRQLMRASS